MAIFCLGPLVVSSPFLWFSGEIGVAHRYKRVSQPLRMQHTLRASSSRLDFAVWDTFGGTKHPAVLHGHTHATTSLMSDGITAPLHPECRHNMAQPTGKKPTYIPAAPPAVLADPVGVKPLSSAKYFGAPRSRRWQRSPEPHFFSPDPSHHPPGPTQRRVLSSPSVRASQQTTLRLD